MKSTDMKFQDQAIVNYEGELVDATIINVWNSQWVSVRLEVGTYGKLVKVRIGTVVEITKEVA